MSDPFTASYPGTTKCPGCKQRVDKGDEVQYAPIDYPAQEMGLSAKTLLWHTSCVWVAANEASASACSICDTTHGGGDGSCLL